MPLRRLVGFTSLLLLVSGCSWYSDKTPPLHSDLRLARPYGDSVVIDLRGNLVDTNHIETADWDTNNIQGVASGSIGGLSSGFSGVGTSTLNGVGNSTINAATSSSVNSGFTTGTGGTSSAISTGTTGFGSSLGIGNSQIGTGTTSGTGR